MAEDAKLDELTDKLKAKDAEVIDLKKRLDAFADVKPDDFKNLKHAYDELKKSFDEVRTENVKLDPSKVETYKKQVREEIEQELGGRYSKKFEELTGNVNALSGEVKQLRVTNVGMQKAANVFNADALPLIKREIESYCDYSDGNVFVKDKDGKPRPSVKDPRSNMDLDEFLGELSSQFPSCVKSTAKKGTKQPGEKMEGGTTDAGLRDYLTNPARREQMTVAERRTYAKQALNNVPITNLVASK